MINIRGVTLELHPLFVIVMLLSIVTGNFIELITLFVIVLIHEMGHLTAAVLLGIKVLSVKLLPFGGVVTMEEHGKLTALKEIVIAVAGPLQNAIMVTIGMVMITLWGEDEYISYIIQGNIIIGLFNLLPIPPLDGGKIIQSLFSRYIPYYRMLLWSARISIISSVGVVIYACLPLMKGEGVIQLNLLIIGIFLFYSNLTDYRNIPYRFMRFLMNRGPIYAKYIMMSEHAQPIITDSTKHLVPILRLFKREKYHLIYIMDELGIPIAVLPEQRLIEAYFSSERHV
ncbi:M50 family metallopeptidase [Paenibacillus sp. CMAA1364]